MGLVTCVTLLYSFPTVQSLHRIEGCTREGCFIRSQPLYLDTILEWGWEEGRCFSGAAMPSQAFSHALGGRVWKASCWGLPLGCLCNGPQVLINAPAKSCQHTHQQLLIISSWNDARSWEKAAPLTSGRNLNFNTRSKRLTLRKLPGTKCTFLGGSDLVCQSLMLIPHTLVYEIQAESFDSLQVAQLWFAVILWNAIRNTKDPINDLSLKA